MGVAFPKWTELSAIQRHSDMETMMKLPEQGQLMAKAASCAKRSGVAPPSDVGPTPGPNEARSLTPEMVAMGVECAVPVQADGERMQRVTHLDRSTALHLTDTTMLRFACGSCRKMLKAKNANLVKSTHCSTCSNMMRILPLISHGSELQTPGSNIHVSLSMMEGEPDPELAAALAASLAEAQPPDQDEELRLAIELSKPATPRPAAPTAPAPVLACRISTGAPAADTGATERERALQRQLEEARTELAALAAHRQKQAVLQWASFDQTVDKWRRSWTQGTHRRAPQWWSKPQRLTLTRRRLELDLLAAVDKVRPAAAMFRDFSVEFLGEDGRDETGLKVDALNHFFRMLYAHPALGVGADGLFETSTGGLVLPRPDAELRGWAVALDSGGRTSPPSGSEESTTGEPKAKRQRCADEGAGDAARTRVRGGGGDGGGGAAGSSGAADSSGAGFGVKYDDGDSEEDVPASRIRAKEQALVVGARVEANFRGGGKFFAGTITKAPPEPGRSSEDVLRLVGRVLAFVLLQGDGFHVSDRLPLFAIQLMATDNCLLDEPQMLEALREWDVESHNNVNMLLEHSMAGFKEALGLDEELRLCDVLSGLRHDGCTKPAGSAAAVQDGPCGCRVLTDANKAELVAECIRCNLRSCRSAGLRALCDGFNGLDRLRWEQADDRELGGRDDYCYSFTYQLQLLTPSEVALRLRGREVAAVEEVWRHMYPVKLDEDAPELAKSVPSDAEFERTAQWLRRKVLEEDIEQARLLLSWVTGRTTFRAFVQHDNAGSFEDDPDAVKIEIYRDEAGSLPTVSTCARMLYLPCYEVPALEAKFTAALEHFKVEAAEKGGAGFGYE